MARSKGTWKYKRRALKDPGRQWGHDQHVALAKACHTVITSNVSQLSALPLFDPFRKSKNMSKKIHKVADDLLKYWESDKATVPTVSAGPADAKMWSSSHSQALAKECRELILQNRRMLNKLPDFENWYPGGNMPRKVGVIADSLLHLYETVSASMDRAYTDGKFGPRRNGILTLSQLFFYLQGSRDDAPKPSAPKGSTTKGKPTSSKANITLTKAREITTPKATRSKLKLELVEGFLEESNDLVTEGKVSDVFACGLSELD